MVKKWVKFILILVGLFYVATPMLVPSNYYKIFVTTEEENPDQESKEEFVKKEMILKEVYVYASPFYSKQQFPCYTHHAMNCLIGYRSEFFMPPEFRM